MKKILRQADVTAGNIQHIKVQRKRWYDDVAFKDASAAPDGAPTWAVSTSARNITTTTTITITTTTTSGNEGSTEGVSKGVLKEEEGRVPKEKEGRIVLPT